MDHGRRALLRQPLTGRLRTALGGVPSHDDAQARATFNDVGDAVGQEAALRVQRGTAGCEIDGVGPRRDFKPALSDRQLEIAIGRQRGAVRCGSDRCCGRLRCCRGCAPPAALRAKTISKVRTPGPRTHFRRPLPVSPRRRQARNGSCSRDRRDRGDGNRISGKWRPDSAPPCCWSSRTGTATRRRRAVASSPGRRGSVQRHRQRCPRRRKADENGHKAGRKDEYGAQVRRDLRGLPCNRLAGDHLRRFQGKRDVLPDIETNTRKLRYRDDRLQSRNSRGR